MNGEVFIRKTLLFTFLFFIVVLFPTDLYGRSDFSLSNKLLRKVSNNPTWRLLLGYDRRGQSQITSDTFFFSSTGETNPFSELKSTLKAFKQNQLENPNNHPQCKYRGRYVWLKRQLPFKKLDINNYKCPKFEEFSGQNENNSASIIFVTGYLNNPASYYGHLLLKFDNQNYNNRSDYRSNTLNNGAIVPENEHLINYIFNGIFGGYNASFTHQKYYYHTHYYGEFEMRDLWEYELNLTKQEQSLLVAHAWEILGQKYTYYFINRNCAYRFARLLQVVLDKSLINRYRFWESPQRLIQELSGMKHNGKPLINDVHYYPSRQTRFYSRYNRLNHKEKKNFRRVTKNYKFLENSKFKSQSLDSKFRITNSLMDYNQYLLAVSESDTISYKKNYKKVLNKRYQLRPGTTKRLFKGNYIKRNSPHKSRLPGYVNFHHIHNEQLNNLFEVKFRPVYYDSLDSVQGHKNYSTLSMAELKLRSDYSKYWVQELNIVKLENIHRNLTGLPGDRQYSWYVNIGAKQRDLSCKNCLAFNGKAGLGYTTNILREQIFMSYFVGAGLLSDSVDEDDLYSSGLLILNADLMKGVRLRASSEYRELLGSTSHEKLFSVRTRYPLKDGKDIRLYFNEHVEQEVGVSLGFYW